MRRVAATVLAAGLAVIAAGPAFAWNFSEVNQNGAILVGAADDTNDGYELAIECDDRNWQPALYIFTSQAWDASAGYADQVPLTITIDGQPNGPLAAAFENVGGELMVTLYPTEEAPLWSLFDAMRQADESITASYFTDSATFGVAAADNIIGKVIERCNQLGGN